MYEQRISRHYTEISAKLVFFCLNAPTSQSFVPLAARDGDITENSYVFQHKGGVAIAIFAPPYCRHYVFID